MTSYVTRAEYDALMARLEQVERMILPRDPVAYTFNLELAKITKETERTILAVVRRDRERRA